MQDKPDDDPTRFLDGWQPRAEPQRGAPMPELDLSALHVGLPGGPNLDAQRIARLKKRGFSMTDIEDVEVPDIPAIRLPVVPPPAAAPDLAGIGAALQAAVAPPPAARADPRLLTRWQPGVWTGVRRRLLGASTELVNTPEGPLVENRPAQWLLAAWPPQGLDAPLLGRWPECALLCAGEGEGTAAADAQLLQGLPAGARLWLSEAEVDWALLAELVLHQDAALAPFQLKALRELVEAQRLAAFERINRGYEPARDGRPLRRKT